MIALIHLNEHILIYAGWKFRVDTVLFPSSSPYINHHWLALHNTCQCRQMNKLIPTSYVVQLLLMLMLLNGPDTANYWPLSQVMKRVWPPESKRERERERKRKSEREGHLCMIHMYSQSVTPSEIVCKSCLIDWFSCRHSHEHSHLYSHVHIFTFASTLNSIRFGSTFFD